MSKVLVDRELLERADKRLTDWLELNDCECEIGHYCGRDDVTRDRNAIRAILAQPAEAEGVRDYLAEFAEGEIEARTAIEELKAALSAVTAERDRLRDQVKALQSDANSWQSGYDKGRHDGTKHRHSEVAQLRAEVEALRKDKARLDAIEQECWDVRFLSTPNGDAGDSSVSIEIVGHFMAEPCERVVGENYNENLRAALDQAMTAEAYPPARPEYDEYGCPVRAAMAAKEA